jgi:hypothetical protein
MKRLVDWYSLAAHWFPYPAMEVIVMIPYLRNVSTTALFFARAPYPHVYCTFA